MQQQVIRLLLASTKIATLVRPRLLVGSLLTRRIFPASDYNGSSNQVEIGEQVGTKFVHNLDVGNVGLVVYDAEDINS